MTREQTIEKLKALYTNAVAAMLRADACDDDESAKVMTEYAETLDSAITALTALQTDGDCISRQAAIDAIEHRLAEPAYQHTGEDWYVGMNCAESEIYELPSVQPEIIRCNDCKWWNHNTDLTYCDRFGTVWVGTDPDDFCSFAERETDE